MRFFMVVFEAVVDVLRHGNMGHAQKVMNIDSRIPIALTSLVVTYSALPSLN